MDTERKAWQLMKSWGCMLDWNTMPKLFVNKMLCGWNAKSTKGKETQDLEYLW